MVILGLPGGMAFRSAHPSVAAAHDNAAHGWLNKIIDIARRGLAGSFIRGSASQRNAAPFLQSEVPHDDDFFSRDRDLVRIPAPDELRVRANDGAGHPCPG